MSVSASAWFNAVNNHPETIDTDSWVAIELAQEPDRLWSAGDLIRLLHAVDIDALVAAAADVRDSIEELEALGFLETVVYFDDDDSLFRIR